MKKGLLLLVCLLMVLFCAAALADGTGFVYELLEDGTASITNCMLHGDIVIPETIDGYTVTNLKKQLFYGTFGITSVTLPKTVTYLGPYTDASEWAYCFSYCYDLQAIHVDPSNTSFLSEDGILYYKDKSVLINYPCAKTGNNFHVPASVSYLACTSFASNEYLKELYLDNKNLGWYTYTFYDCPNLTVYYLPGGKTEQLAAQYGQYDGYPTFVEWSTGTPTPEPTTTPSHTPTSTPTPTPAPTSTPTATGLPPTLSPQTPIPVITPEPTATSQPPTPPPQTPVPVISPTPTATSGNTELTVEGLKYKLSGSTATVTGPENKNAKKLKIPAKITVDGTSYKVTAIQAKAFKGMKKLTGVEIGKNVKNIGKSAFQDCDKLKTITIKTSKLTVSTVKSKAFKGIYKKATFKCPKKKLEAYKKLLIKRGAPKTCKFK